MSEVKPKRKPGRPKWTEEQRAEYYRKKEEREAAGIAPPERGMGGKKNFLSLGIGDSPEDKALISKIISESRVAFKMPKPKSDEELEARLDSYFAFCEERGCVPTVEELGMYIGYSRFWMRDIREGRCNGFSPRTRETITKVSEFMASIDAKLVMAGKVRDAIYIFRSKNYHGMKDEQELTVSANTGSEQEMSKEQIEQWFLDDGKKVETEFREE